MFAIFKHLRDKWNDWCGDHEMELAIRQHLTSCGYFGRTAKLKSVRLVAVQRPGWLQIYRFEATARLDPEQSGGGQTSSGMAQALEPDAVEPESLEHAAVVHGSLEHGPLEHGALEHGALEHGPREPEYHELYGLFREDARRKENSTRVFASEGERRSLFTQWSEGLICLRGSQGL